MKIVVDTSILIDHLRGGSVWRKVVMEIREDTQLYVPTIIFFELFSGQSTKDPDIVSRIYSLLVNFQRIDLNEDIAKLAGQLFRDNKKKLEVQDNIIAATALQLGGSVLTLNRKHFETIPNLELYPF